MNIYIEIYSFRIVYGILHFSILDRNEYILKYTVLGFYIEHDIWH